MILIPFISGAAAGLVLAILLMISLGLTPVAAFTVYAGIGLGMPALVVWQRLRSG